MTDIIIIREADEETIRRILAKEKYVPAPEQSKKEDKQKKDVPKTKNTSKIVWTKKEILILKTYYTAGNPNWTLLKQLLPDRTRNAIQWRAFDLGLSKKHKQKFESKKRKYTRKIEEKVEKSKGFFGVKNSIWTKKEDKIVKENYSASGKINWKTFRQLLPHRTKGSIQVRACYLKITNRNRLHAKPKKHKKIDGRKRKHRIVPRYQIEAGLKAIDKYHKFTKERSIYYQKAGYNEPDSRRIAIADWHRQKGHTQIPTQPSLEPMPIVTAETTKTKAVVPENFPTFESISKDFNTLLESIVKHIVANKGSKLNFLNTKDILDVQDGKQWHNFVAEFMTKSQMIADYFNVPNKFKHLRTNEGYDVLIYES